MIITLNALREGERARIVAITGDDTISVRLMEMGLIEDEQVELIGFAPLGDPIEFRIRGYRLSLRSREAERVQVERLDPAPPSATGNGRCIEAAPRFSRFEPARQRGPG